MKGKRRNENYREWKENPERETENGRNQVDLKIPKSEPRQK